jgi:hypothetical protein
MKPNTIMSSNNEEPSRLDDCVFINLVPWCVHLSGNLDMWLSSDKRYTFSEQTITSLEQTWALHSRRKRSYIISGKYLGY